MRRKIIFVLLCSFFAAIIVFSFTMNWYLTNYDPFHKWVDIQHKNLSNQEKIFILGSSQVASMNITDIEKNLNVNEKKYLVYNLAVGADFPSSRLGDIDAIIALKPSLIVYGVGFRDFEKKPQMTTSSVGATHINSEKIFPTLQIMNEKTILILQENEFVNKIFKSPKVITLRLFNYVIKNDFGYNYPDITLKTPLIQSAITPIISNNDLEQKFVREQIFFRGIEDFENNHEFLAFEKILQKLNNNKIKTVVYTTPYNKLLLSKISNTDKSYFMTTLSKISEENNASIYFLHDKYVDLEVWGDLYHVAYNNQTLFYGDDVTKIILKEINQ